MAHSMQNFTEADASRAYTSGKQIAIPDVDTRLRQLINTLCWVACGHGKDLDKELSNIIHLINNESATTAQFDAALSQLTSIIGTLPKASNGGTASASATTQQHASLLWLLDGLSAIPPLRKRILEIRHQASHDNGSKLFGFSDQASTLVLDHFTELEAERAHLIGLLDRIAADLGNLSETILKDVQLRKQAYDESQNLNQQLMGEVEDLGANVGRSNDLALLQDEVRMGLSRINEGLQESRLLEQARMQEFEQREQQMQAHINRLEAETQQLRESVAKEHRTACTDWVTTLPNRFAYDLRVKQEQQNCRQAGLPLIIAVWDIDHFKKINDTCGHQAGDKALHAVGQCLAQQLRANDFFARYGGEEFVMMIPNMQIDQALATVDRLRQSVASIGFHFRQQPVPLTISCGLTLVRDDDTPESAFERADTALLNAKSAGRNCCVVG